MILSLSSGRGLSIEALLCSGVSQAVDSTYDWIFLYTSKANWTCDVVDTELSKKLEACDIHSELSLQHGYYSYLKLPSAVMAMSQQSLPWTYDLNLKKQ